MGFLSENSDARRFSECQVDQLMSLLSTPISRKGNKNRTYLARTLDTGSLLDIPELSLDDIAMYSDEKGKYEE